MSICAEVPTESLLRGYATGQLPGGLQALSWLMVEP
jgi:hypothetical protein